MTAKKRIDWEKVSDAELLKTRICDLPISIEDNGLPERIAAVWDELDDKGIHFHPECYLADEWFSPEGDPVVGIPFYLAHPRLIKLERAQILEAEGDREAWFFELLRHEFGHALDHAYDLRKFSGFKKTFGASSKPYPTQFRPKPYSRSFVLNLQNSYAQIHPDEDFAETFAVWLKSDFDWREKYRGWPALKKLEFVDTMMDAVTQSKPKRMTGDFYCALPKLRLTLATYYKRKRREYEDEFPDFFDPDLRRIFPQGEEKGSETAAAFLRKHRAAIIKDIAFWTGERKVVVRNLFQRFVTRCSELRLRATRGRTETMVQVVACLTSIVTRYFHTGRFKKRK